MDWKDIAKKEVSQFTSYDFVFNKLRIALIISIIFTLIFGYHHLILGVFIIIIILSQIPYKKKK
ncbi:hypothetical protein HOD20_05810 [archaeon]|jgi:hypothetical protein|nr:hypothetical protein [archaeon]MBT4352019.1 hypothetical protein [archaeon]MBT4647108.1 hypothetical protein [archaeon]MBT6821098.1 hypothetical protein [archaeon]MBT7392192.1 hypothetical protein [archaeon]